MADVDVKKVAADILRRLDEDGTKDDAVLMIAYREAGAFRRMLVDKLGAPKSGERWFSDPSYPLTGANLRALCEAIAAERDAALEEAAKFAVWADHGKSHPRAKDANDTIAAGIRALKSRP